MEHFKTGDRVVCVNADMSRAMKPPAKEELHAYQFPDGPLRKDVIYHVAKACDFASGQSLYITGLRVFWGKMEMPWCGTRFRKVDALKGHVPEKRKRREPKKKTLAIAHV